MLLRILKITLGLSLTAVGIWALLLPPFFPSSSYSVVNARKVKIEAPVDGSLKSLEVAPRTDITRGQTIASIALDRRSVEKNLQELQFAESRLVAKIEISEERLRSLRASLSELEKFQLKRQSHIVAGLKIEQAGIEDSIELLQQESRILKEDARRIKRLLEDGIITKARWSEVNLSTVEADSRLQEAINRRNRIAKDLELAENGLLQSENEEADGPSTEVSVASSRYEIRAVEAELSDLRLKLNETQRLIENSERYLSTASERTVHSPVDGLVWSSHAVEGQSVSTGQPIIQVADRSAVFVQGFFHRYYEESISLGDHAFVRLTGGEDNLTGRVVDIQVQEHGSSDLHVINSVAPSSTMLRVIIEVDSIDLTPDMVGRLGKVVLTRDRPGLLNQSLVWLSLRIRNS